MFFHYLRGRTNTIKLFHEVEPGERIFYMDFNSKFDPYFPFSVRESSMVESCFTVSLGW